MKDVILKVDEIDGNIVYMDSGSFEIEFSKRSKAVKGMKFKEGDKYKLTLTKVK